MALRRVAVVGAGLAGLSAALDLKRHGCEVMMFERSRLLGGKATSFEVEGVEVDNGQHVYLACCTEFIDFIQQLEEGSARNDSLLVLQPRFEALLLARGRPPSRLRAMPLPAPLDLAAALLSYRHLAPAARLRVARAMLAARGPVPPDQTFATWLHRHGQDEAARRAFWDPFFVPALNAPLEDVSADAGLFVMRTAFLGASGAARFGYCRVPLARIAEAAARRLDEVHLRSPVATLDVANGQQDEAGLRGIILEDGKRVACDAVVLAVPPARLKRLVGSPEALGVFGLDAFESAPIIDVHLWYDIASVGFDFAALLESPVQWIFQKGRGYVCCSMSAAQEHISCPSQELVALCDQELRAVIPALRGAALLRSAATRDRDATFIPKPGLQRPGPTTRCPQVVIAGAWTDTGWPATMESAVRSGRAAVRALLQSKRWSQNGSG